MSRPARGAWIEMDRGGESREVNGWGRAPHGARGLKFLIPLGQRLLCLVAPRTGRVD